MAFLEILEADANYVAGLTAMLLKAGAKQTAPTVFQMSNEAAFDAASAFHGVRVSAQPPGVGQAAQSADRPALSVLSPNYARETEWLLAYNGMFEFYLSVKRQFEQRGQLSPKQWSAIARAVDKDAAAPKAAAVATKPKEFSIAVGTIVVVGKFKAKELAARTGLVRPHYAFEILAVEHETEKAYLLTLKCSGQRTTRCGICGMHLTNPESVTNGIGPICAEKVGVGYSGQSLEELKALLETTKEIKSVWLPKTGIKEMFKPGHLALIETIVKGK